MDLAQQKYNDGDYTSAFNLLLELYSKDNAHIPTLLLLGCTCFALKLYHLAIFYNNLILNIDPTFAEAHSNLGSTYRAMSETDKEAAKLAEACYKTALSLRPRYWDAAINLSGLLSCSNRMEDAIQVYHSLELSIDISAFPSPTMETLLNLSDIEQLHLLASVEMNRRRFLTAYPHLAHASHGELSFFALDKRRDVHFAKANLFLTLQKFSEAKLELFKALIALGINLTPILSTPSSQNIPNGWITPHEALQRHYSRMHLLDPIYHPMTSTILQSLAKYYQDRQHLSVATSIYYLSLSFYPAPNACNNIGIILSTVRPEEAIQWYEIGLTLDPRHVHLYTNLGSALKDTGRVTEGVHCYQKAIHLQPDFHIALANLANVYKDLGRIEESISFYRQALAAKPDFIEAFCNYVNTAFFICDWTDREENLKKINQLVKIQLKEGALIRPKTIPPVLPFHTFTYSLLTAWMVREICQRNADRALFNVTSSSWFPGFPKRPASCIMNGMDSVSVNTRYPYPYPLPKPPEPHLKIGYVSSDFNNHPLAHLMQSVFGMHNRQNFKVYCYSLSPSDHSPYRLKIEHETDVFLDVSQWTTQAIVERIVNDGIHILCNLNGYTKGGRNEIFAARPAPLQLALMGYAGTMGAGTIQDPKNPDDKLVTDYQLKGGSYPDDSLFFFDDVKKRWIDYMVVDEIVVPRSFICGERLNEDEPDGQYLCRNSIKKNLDSNRIYTEGMIYMPYSFFVNDHRQGFTEPNDPEVDYLVHLYQSHAFLPPPPCQKPLEAGGLIGEVCLCHDVHLSEEERLRWTKEELMRLKMRRALFPWMREDTVIFANFNQLYKIDPDIFKTWLNILKAVPNSILWLLRFPAAGEKYLRAKAVKMIGEEVARRIVFTGTSPVYIYRLDVASKNIHIYRGRIADVFLDTPECNAHTTAADILWSGTPLITFPKYDFKLSSRVAASCAYGLGSWTEGRNQPEYSSIPGLKMNLERLEDDYLIGHHLVVNSYQEYEERAIIFGKSMKWGWKQINSWKSPNPCQGQCPLIGATSPIFVQQEAGIVVAPSPYYPSPSNAGYIFVPTGLSVRIRRHIFLNRERLPLFNTEHWVRSFEIGVMKAFSKWTSDYNRLAHRNELEKHSNSSLISIVRGRKFYERCIFACT